ncbi:hypothetical protein DKM19_30960 [Streptosporangium sp. 'caverna']|nr:hypothetical protein DKM19_30960 [Streptosporangium sp. 'caverna']
MEKITIRDIARLAGVSRSTVPGRARVRTGPQLGHGHLRSHIRSQPSRRPRLRVLTQRFRAARPDERSSRHGMPGGRSRRPVMGRINQAGPGIPGIRRSYE